MFISLSCNSYHDGRPEAAGMSRTAQAFDAPVNHPDVIECANLRSHPQGLEDLERLTTVKTGMKREPARPGRPHAGDQPHG
jgi:hypothetical protein